ncbi:MAG: DUF5658 family protein, partial [Candidatus Aminicenantes bacterium]
MKTLELFKRYHWKLFAVLSVLLFFTTSVFAANKDFWDSSSLQKDSSREDLDFGLKPIPIKSLSLGHPHRMYLTFTELPQKQSQQLVMPYSEENLRPHTNTLEKQKASKLQDSLFTASLITLTALNIGDYLFTIQALKHEELEEANPAMKPFTENIYLFTAVKLGATAFNVLLLNKLYRKNKPLAWILRAAANFAMSYVVAN